MQPIYILALVFASAFAQRPIDSWLESSRHTPWGDWEDEAICPPQTFVTGFRLKVQPDQGLLLDDTSLNSIELICNGPGVDEPTRVKSGEGAKGTWGNFRECLAPAKGSGFEMRTEAAPTFDNTAANNFALYCDGSRMEGTGTTWGDWRGPLSCPTGTSLCGIRAQHAFQLPSAIDDTALNNVDMACCSNSS